MTIAQVIEQLQQFQGQNVSVFAANDAMDWKITEVYERSGCAFLRLEEAPELAGDLDEDIEQEGWQP